MKRLYRLSEFKDNLLQIRRDTTHDIELYDSLTYAIKLVEDEIKGRGNCEQIMEN